MAEGDSGWNENNTRYYSVSGIGRSKTARIAYKVLNEYFEGRGDTCSIKDAGFYAMEAARELFGDCSNELNQVIKAFHAISVLNNLPNQDPVTDICGVNSQDWIEHSAILAPGHQCQELEINPTDDVTFKGWVNIILKPGFHAKAGSRFRAFVEPCIPQNYQGYVHDPNSAIFDELNSEINENPTGISSNEETIDFNVFPNPTNRKLTLFNISGKPFGETNIRIVNMTGNIIFSKKLLGEDNVISLDLSNFPPGLYSVSVEYENQVKSKRIAVTN